MTTVRVRRRHFRYAPETMRPSDLRGQLQLSFLTITRSSSWCAAPQPVGLASSSGLRRGLEDGPIAAANQRSTVGPPRVRAPTMPDLCCTADESLRQRGKAPAARTCIHTHQRRRTKRALARTHFELPAHTRSVTYGSHCPIDDRNNAHDQTHHNTYLQRIPPHTLRQPAGRSELCRSAPRNRQAWDPCTSEAPPSIQKRKPALDGGDTTPFVTAQQGDEPWSRPACASPMSEHC